MASRRKIALAYARAPRLTFLRRHPRAAFKAWTVMRGLRGRRARRLTAATFGLGALSVVLPVVLIWALRR